MAMENDGKRQNERLYITSIMTKRDIGDIVSTDKNKADENKSRKERIMTTVNFVYYLNSEHYETLHSKEKKQGLVLVRSCKVRKRKITV